MFIRLLTGVRFIGVVTALLFNGQSGFAATLFPFPEPESGAHEYVSSLLCYIATGLNIQTEPHNICIKGTDVLIDETPVTVELQQALKDLASQIRPKPQNILGWWDGAQIMTRTQRDQHVTIPDKLNEFVRLTQFNQWPRMVVRVSMVKKLTRVIYRSPVGYSPTISVAVTHESQSGDLSAPVRETEVAIERHDQSGNADFYSYDHAGQISKTSTFPSGEKPSPSSCLGCHFDRNARTFTREGM